MDYIRSDRASASEIVDFILQDLETAASMLPANHDESNWDVLLKHSKSFGFKADIILCKSVLESENDITKWQTAASTAKAAIDYAEQNGYRLADNYADIFSATVNRKSFGAKTLVEVNVFGGIGMVFL